MSEVCRLGNLLTSERGGGKGKREPRASSAILKPGSFEGQTMTGRDRTADRCQELQGATWYPVGGSGGRGYLGHGATIEGTSRNFEEKSSGGVVGFRSCG